MVGMAARQRNEISESLSLKAWNAMIGGAGFWTPKHCEVCGTHFYGADDVKRCPKCPPDGMVACPATHGGALCRLCRGTGWVEELV